MKMKKNIFNWLKTKENFFYYEERSDNLYSAQKRLSNMLFNSRIHYSNLEASDCYIIENISDKIDYYPQHPRYYKHNFENFNTKRNEYIYDKANMKEACKKFTTEDSVQNRVIVIDLLNELKHGYISKNKFLEKFDKYKYKDIFFDTNKNSYQQFIDDAENSLKTNQFSLNDFKSAYIDKIQNESKNLKEIGVYYPFMLDCDIFKNNHYIFEINHIKFQKPNNNFLDLINKFYKEYGLNSNTSKEIFSLEKYFMHPGFNYSKQFAYFNPFQNYEKYKKQYKALEKNISDKKLNFKNFIFELFEFLNKAQIGVVKFQHENLINSLTINRSTNRLSSVRELIDIQIKKLKNNEQNLDSFSIQWNLVILQAFKTQPSDFKFTKNTKVDDIETFKTWPDKIRKDAQLVLDDLLNVSNKSNISKLQYIFNHYKKHIVSLVKKYKLNVKNKHTLNDMLMDLIFFYNDKSNEKLSKPYNSTIESIYLNNQNKDISKLIDFDFQKNFIQKNRSNFEKYQSYEIETEDGKTKYMMVH